MTISDIVSTHDDQPMVVKPIAIPFVWFSKNQKSSRSPAKMTDEALVMPVLHLVCMLFKHLGCDDGGRRNCDLNLGLWLSAWLNHEFSEIHFLGPPIKVKKHF